MTDPRVSDRSEARQAVLRVLAARHDHFATQEQLLVEQGEYDKAAEAHAYANAVLRAYRAELDNPGAR